ncbi:MAG TPA: DUF2784 domain-containing protein [Acidobacteriaceae bacterium]|nr:DUF2784 domain-containing protein [Acidobacteriaceae bacterium]
MKVLAIAVLLVHIVWILAVIFGALFTRGRPGWSAVHIACLIWGIVVELGPWPCPLTLLEQHLETLAGMQAYQGSFLLHYLDRIVYPNLPWWLVGSIGASVCALNLGIYGWRFRRAWVRRRAARAGCTVK